MKKAKEKSLEPELVRRVEIRDGLCIKLLPFVMAGLPDRLVLLKGRAFFAETKTEGKKLRRVQRVVHRMLKKVGFPVWTIDSYDVLEEFLDYIDDETR